MNIPLPHNRAQDISPISAGSDSAWSGMNGYNVNNMRPDGPYAAAPFPRADSMPRSDSISPPEPQVRMNGMPPNPAFGFPGMGPNQRRRPSEAGSQQSSRAASIANSRSSDGTISDQQSRRYRRMETELQQHYTILKSFLRGGAQQPPRPNKARDKLLRLSPVQFHELSTDVFDELQRRQAAAPLPGREPRQKNIPPFLQPVPQFHEKRNQARQKLSSLQTPRFRDLATDVFCELERRFPLFANPEGRRRDSSRSTASRAGGRPPLPQVQTSNGPAAGSSGFPQRNGSMPGGVPQFDNPPGSAVSSSGSEFGRPMPKQFQSNTITPNKSTMIEDDEDEDDAPSPNYSRGRSSDAFGLESAIASPNSDRGMIATHGASSSREMKVLQQKTSSLEFSLQQKNNEISTMKMELERKVEDAERLNRSLQDQLDRLHADHANLERDLRSQIESAKQPTKQDQSGGIWKDKHDQLQHEHNDLRLRFDEQQTITEEVSRQGEMFLSEMRAMAEGGTGNYEREEKLQLTVHKLEEELKEWKARYAKAKTQLRNARATSGGFGIRGPDAARYTRDATFHSPEGAVKDVHISQFQISIDELLQTARSADPTAVLATMKEVVLAVRNITLDVDGADGMKDEEAAQRKAKLRSKVSATANNVITATKNFAAAGGLSPVSLLDAAASHLTAAVVDLIQLVKVRPMAPEDEIDEDGFVQVQNTPDPINDAGYFNMNQQLGRSSVADSEYSALSSPLGGADGPGPSTDTPATSHSINANPTNGLGIQANVALGEDDTELQELKIYLENQTDLLVQTIQALVTSIRNDDPMSSIQAHISAIVDIVENVLSAAEGAMEDPSSYQAELRQKAAAVVKSLTEGKDKLLQAVSDPKANVAGPSSKTFTQRLPPLAFSIARETKELVARIESVEASKGDDDFS